MKGAICALRWPESDDYDRIAAWLRPMSHAAALTGDTHEAIDAAALRQAAESGRVRYFVVVSRDGEPVGVVNYRAAGGGGAHSYAMGGAVGISERWQAGYGAEALSLLTDFVFHQLNAHRVEFSTASYNRHSLQVLTRDGFTLEGVLRDYYFVDGEYHHRTIWSILRHEYYANRAEYGRRLPMPELVPAEDKARARESLAKYLANDGPSSWGEMR